MAAESEPRPAWFLGTYVRKLDRQRRLTLPPQFTRHIDNRKEALIYINKSVYNRVLYCSPHQNLGENPIKEPDMSSVLKTGVGPERSQMERLANTYTVRPLGRLTIPEGLYKYMGSPKSVAIIGAGEAFYIADSEMLLT